MKENAAVPNYHVSEEQYSKVQFQLVGLEKLVVVTQTVTYRIKRELHPESGIPYKILSKKKIRTETKSSEFSFNKVTAKEVESYRESGVPCFLLKVEGELSLAIIPDSINFTASNMLGEHLCSAAKRECSRLSAASDENGGCAKVREYASCIEKYPWITSGYETFNTKHDSFIVAKCLHYKKCPPRPKLSAREISRLKLGLAQYVWDDVNSLAEVQARKMGISLEALKKKNTT